MPASNDDPREETAPEEDAPGTTPDAPPRAATHVPPTPTVRAPGRAGGPLVTPPAPPSGGERRPWAEVLAASAAWVHDTAGEAVDYREDAVVLEPCPPVLGRKLEAICQAVLPAAGWSVTFTSMVGGRFVAVIA